MKKMNSYIEMLMYFSVLKLTIIMYIPLSGLLTLVVTLFPARYAKCVSTATISVLPKKIIFEYDIQNIHCFKNLYY